MTKKPPKAANDSSITPEQRLERMQQSFDKDYSVLTEASDVSRECTGMGRPARACQTARVIVLASEARMINGTTRRDRRRVAGHSLKTPDAGRRMSNLWATPCEFVWGKTVGETLLQGLGLTGRIFSTRTNSLLNAVRAHPRNTWPPCDAYSARLTLTHAPIGSRLCALSRSTDFPSMMVL